MVVIYILFILIVIFSILVTILSINLNKYQETIIRINEVESNIDSTLNKRFDLLSKASSIIKDKLNLEEEALTNISNIRSKKFDIIELDEELYKTIEEFHDYSDKYVELSDLDEYTKIEIQLIESEAEIVALKKYYNDIVNKYNELLITFPTSLIAKFKKYNHKNIFQTENHQELINILKEQNKSIIK